MSNPTKCPVIDQDDYEAECYESFDSVYYMNDASSLVDGSDGLYAVDEDGLAVGFLADANISAYMNWVYIYMK